MEDLHLSSKLKAGVFQIDPIVTAYYDSFILYSTAASRLLRREGVANITDGQKIANEMKNTTLDSPLGYPINMDFNGDRSRTYVIRDLNLDTGKFTV